MQSDQEKTEKPTIYRIQQAKKHGFIKYSHEVSSFLILISGIIISYFYGQNIFMMFLKLIIAYLSFNHSVIHNNFLFSKAIFVLHIIIYSLFLFFFIYLIFLMVVCIMFNGFTLNLKFIKFSSVNINFFRIIENIFSNELYIHFCKVLLKMLVIFLIFFFYLKYVFLNIIGLIFLPDLISFQIGFRILLNCICFLFVGFIPVVIIDILWNKFSYYNHLKMTYQQIRDEHKEHESKKKYCKMVKKKKLNK